MTLACMRVISFPCSVLLDVTLAPRTMQVQTFRFPTLRGVLIMVVLVMVGREISVSLILVAFTWRLEMPTMLLIWLATY